MEKPSTPSHNNQTKHVSLEQIKREAAANKLREHDVDVAHEQAVHASKAISPLEDINVLAKAPEGYDESNGPWSAENPESGFDGAADLAEIAEAVAKDPSRQYAPWEKTFVNHMKNEASVLKEKSKVDFAAINTPREGDPEGTNPMDNRLREVYDKLNAKFNEVGTEQGADLIRKTIKGQMQDVQAFGYFHRNPNEVPRAVTGSVAKEYAMGGKFEERMKVRTARQEQKEAKRVDGINTELQTLEAKLAAAQDAGEFAVINGQIDALKDTLGNTLPIPEWSSEQRTQRNTQIAMLDERRKANTRDINVYRLLAQEFPLTPEDAEDDTDGDAEKTAEQAPVSEKMAELIANHEKLGNELAAMNASRILAMRGADSRANYRNGKNAVEYRELKASYDEANKALLMQKILDQSSVDGGFKTEAELNLFIAEQTLDANHTLEGETVTNVMNKNRRLGKVMNFLSGRNDEGERVKSKKRMAVHFLIGAGLAAGTILSGGVLAPVAGGYAGLSMYASLDARAKNKWMNADRVVEKENILSALENTTPDRNAKPDESAEQAHVRTLVRKIEAATREANVRAEKDILNQQNKRRNRALGSVAFGVAITGASTLLSGAFNGSESTANAAPTRPTAER
ncbi:MAG: hypothetical protein EOO17_04040 [Chloroflexi bacterium]|nr:MAG: hypothetical protein EOO17_04040 [Chloroflexota bacterium]